MRKIKTLGILVIFTLLTVTNLTPLTAKTSSPSILISEFNKGLLKDKSVNLYFNNSPLLIKGKMESKGKLTHFNYQIDNDLDDKVDKIIDLYFDGKFYYVTSSALQKATQKNQLIKLTTPQLLDPKLELSQILSLSDLYGVVNMDLSIKLSQYKQIKSDSKILTYQALDKTHYLDLILNLNTITSADYYTLKDGQHKSLKVLVVNPKPKRVSLPKSSVYLPNKLTPDLKAITENYNIIKTSGQKMVTGFLSVVVNKYINQPGSDFNTVFDETYLTLPENYQSYSPTAPLMPSGLKAIDFQLSGYEVCGFIELDENKIVKSQTIILDGPCI